MQIFPSQKSTEGWEQQETPTRDAQASRVPLFGVSDKIYEMLITGITLIKQTGAMRIVIVVPVSSNSPRIGFNPQPQGRGFFFGHPE
jgi:hypothetical protein